ncbi:MAG: hypothetical protein WBP61_18735 [Nocardioides sp.]
MPVPGTQALQPPSTGPTGSGTNPLETTSRVLRGERLRATLLFLAAGQAIVCLSFVFMRFALDFGWMSEAPEGAVTLAVTGVVAWGALGASWATRRTARALGLILGIVALVVLTYWAYVTKDIWPYLGELPRGFSLSFVIGMLAGFGSAVPAIALSAAATRIPAPAPVTPSAPAPGFYAPSATVPAGHVGGVQPSAHAVPLPAITATVVVTALAGLFGLIPAVLHSNRANQVGESGAKYWTAFAVTLVIGFLFWVGAYIGLTLLFLHGISTSTGY